MTVIKNFTPHDIHLYEGSTLIATFPATGIVTRVNEATMDAGTVGSTHYPLCKKVYENIIDLPPPVPGTYYIVSMMVMNAIPRDDLICPDTGSGAVRNDKGMIVGTSRFVCK